MPEISVIVPAHNAEKYIVECIESIISQSFRDFELIIIDDASDDATFEICDKYARDDSRIKIYREQFRDVSCSRNCGIDHAGGEYIFFADSDDTIHPRALEILHTIITECNTEIVTAAAVYAKEYTFKTHLIGLPSYTIYDSDEAIKISLYQKSLLNTGVWGKLYKTSILNRTDSRGNKLRFRERLLSHEDLELLTRLYDSTGKIAHTDAVLYFYRDNSSSFLHRWSEHRPDVLHVVDDIEIIFANRPTLLAAARDRKFNANFNIFLAASRYGKTDVADRCWDNIKKYRVSSLRNPEVRLKTKIGAVLSYIGKPLFKMLSLWIGQ